MSSLSFECATQGGEGRGERASKSWRLETGSSERATLWLSEKWELWIVSEDCPTLHTTCLQEEQQ